MKGINQFESYKKLRERRYFHALNPELLTSNCPEENKAIVLNYIDEGFDVNVRGTDTDKGYYPLEAFFSDFYYLPRKNGETMFIPPNVVSFVVDNLILAGIDPNLSERGLGALFYATWHLSWDPCHYESIKKMILYGYDMNTYLPDKEQTINEWVNMLKNPVGYVDKLNKWNDLREELKELDYDTE